MIDHPRRLDMKLPIDPQKFKAVLITSALLGIGIGLMGFGWNMIRTDQVPGTPKSGEVPQCLDPEAVAGLFGQFGRRRQCLKGVQTVDIGSNPAVKIANNMGLTKAVKIVSMILDALSLRQEEAEEFLGLRSTC
jgi:hypothetical protein